MCWEIIYLIYMYKKDLALHGLQLLICHKTKPTNQPTNHLLLRGGQESIILKEIEIVWLEFEPSRMA